MIGGANCESEMGLTTHEKFPWVDYVVSGEADSFIVDLVNSIRNRGRGVPEEELPHGVSGPVHRTLDYTGLRDAPFRAVVESLDGLPTPNYDDYFEQIRNTPSLLEVADPGWFGTLFPTLAQMDQLYGISCETSPNLTKDQIRIMAEAGVDWVQPGIESLDPETLVLPNRGTKAWLNVRFLKWCMHYGINVRWCLLDKVPGCGVGRYAGARELMPSLYHLSPPILNDICILRFSRYQRQPEDYHIELTPEDMYSRIYPLPQAEIYNIEAIFYDRTQEKTSDQMEFGTEGFSERQKLAEQILEWWRLFESKNRPALFSEDSGTEISIRDT
jgi:hypothetical protein